MRKKDGSERGEQDRNSVPNDEKQIGTRIKAVAGLYETRASAAKIAGISDDMLYRYIRGSKPSFDAIAKMCIGKGVRMEWVWSGQGPMYQDEEIKEEVAYSGPAALSRAIMGDVIEVVTQELVNKGIRLDPDKMKELMLLIHDEISEQEQQDIEATRGKVIRFMKVIK